MWTWESELREWGFRRRSHRYWRCERRYGLPDYGHVSVFPWSEHRHNGGLLVQLTDFHVTLVLEGEHIHFYYHECGENAWGPGGYTSRREIERIGHDLRALRRLADEIAKQIAEAMGGVFVARGSR